MYEEFKDCKIRLEKRKEIVCDFMQGKDILLQDYETKIKDEINKCKSKEKEYNVEIIKLGTRGKGVGKLNKQLKEIREYKKGFEKKKEKLEEQKRLIDEYLKKQEDDIYVDIWITTA